jgi:hypothetical protein
MLLLITLASSFYHVALGLPCRDALSWPFLSNSIWNTAIGSDAVLSPANLYPMNSLTLLPPRKIQPDDVWFVKTLLSDPVVPVYDQGHWGKPTTNAAYCNITGKQNGTLHFPSHLNFTNFGGNNCGVILAPDNRTLQFLHPLYVCEPGAPILALTGASANGAHSADLYTSTGNLGGLGGSGLSGIGGAIRLGQLVPNAPPISHALNLQLYAQQYYFPKQPGNNSACFRWPAIQCDDCETCYGGTNPQLVPGALLVVPRVASVLLNVSLVTAPARAILAALTNYGAYLVADAAWPAMSFCTEGGVQAEFAAAWGYSFEAQAGNAWYDDIVSILRALSIVTNNAISTQGGGGTPLMPPPPPFC